MTIESCSLSRPRGWLAVLGLALGWTVAAPAVAQSPPRYYMITDLGPGDATRIQNYGLGYTIGSLELPLCIGAPGPHFGFYWEGATNRRLSFCPRMGDALSEVFDFEMLGYKSAVGLSRTPGGVDMPVIWNEQADGSFASSLMGMPAGATGGVAWGTEWSGRVAGEVTINGEHRAAYWLLPSWAPWTFPLAGNSAGFAIAGSFFDPVVGAQHDGRFALWYPNRSPGVTYPLGETPSVGFRLGQDVSRFLAIGQLTAEGGHRAFLWQSDTGVSLLPNLPFGSNSGARDFLDAGHIVGFGHDSLGWSRAVLWEGINTLNLDELKLPTCRNDDPIACAPWTLESAASISPAGVIVGSGRLVGQPHAFLARPVEPLYWSAGVCAVTSQPLCVPPPTRTGNELIIDPFEVKEQQPPKSASAANAYAAGAKGYAETNGIWIPNASGSFRSYVVFEPKSVMDALLPGQTGLDVRFHFKLDGTTAGSGQNTIGSVGAGMALRPARNYGEYSSISGSLQTVNGATQPSGAFAGQGVGPSGDVELPLQLQPFNGNPLEVRIEGSVSTFTLASGGWASAEGSLRFCSEDPRSITLIDGTPLMNLGIKYTMWPTVRRDEDEDDPCRNPLKDVPNETPVCDGGTGAPASFRVTGPDVIAAGESVELVGVGKPDAGTVTATVMSGNATIEGQRPCVNYPDESTRCPVTVRGSSTLGPESVVVIRLTYSYLDNFSPCRLESTVTLRGSRLQFVDPMGVKEPTTLMYPFPPLNGQPVEFLRRDAAILSREGRPVAGLAADGVTPVLLRFRAPGPGTVTFTVSDERNSRDAANVGRLADPFVVPPAYTNPLTVTTRPVGGEYWAFAVITAPRDFVRPDVPSDAERGFDRRRRLPVQVDFAPGGGAPGTRITRDLDLVRPPVLLMHGVWSDVKSWGWALQKDPARFFSYAHDYGKDSGKSFRENYQQGRKGMDLTLQGFRQSGLAAAQADVLAHSMGGNLMRIYATGPGYGQNIGMSPARVRAEAPVYKERANYGAGTIHKLVFFNSPQLGTPLANLMFHQAWIRSLFEAVRNEPRVRGEAVEDLRRDGDAILAQPGFGLPPVHAMLGGGGDQFIDDLFASKQWIARIAKSILRFEFNPEPDHDVIVGVCSQRANLDLGLTADFFPTNFKDSMHTNNKRAPGYNDEAVRLLNATVTSGLFSPGLIQPIRGFLCEGFGASPQRTAALAPTSNAPAPATKPVPKLLDGGLVITSPASGTVVTAGSTVQVSVEAAGGFVPDRIIVGAGEVADSVAGSQFAGPFTIPETEFGEIELRAVGLDAQNEIAAAVPIVIRVEAPAALTGLAPMSGLMILNASTPTSSLAVTGTFADGVDRDATSPGAGTTYESQNPAVATVDAAGVVTAVAGGTTLVHIANGDFEASVEVRVLSTPADADGDGDVDLADFLALRACWSGPGEDEGFQAPGNACRDVFDADSDGDVDADDYPPFLARYTGPQADCNGNGVMDLTDIVQGTSQDADGNGVPDECGS